MIFMVCKFGNFRSTAFNLELRFVTFGWKIRREMKNHSITLRRVETWSERESNENEFTFMLQQTLIIRVCSRLWLMKFWWMNLCNGKRSHLIGARPLCITNFSLPQNSSSNTNLPIKSHWARITKISLRFELKSGPTTTTTTRLLLPKFLWPNRGNRLMQIEAWALFGWNGSFQHGIMHLAGSCY